MSSDYFVPTDWDDSSEHRRKIANAVNHLLNLPLGGVNYFCNGELSLWQHGVSETPSSGIFNLADGIKAYVVGSTLGWEAVQTSSLELPGVISPSYFLRINVSGIAGNNNYAFISLPIEMEGIYSEQEMVFSFWVKSDASRRLAIEIYEDFGTSGSESISDDSIPVSVTEEWKRVFFTLKLGSQSGKTITGNACYRFNIWFDAGSGFSDRASSIGHQSGTFDIACPKIEFGSYPTSFFPRPLDQRVIACQRYFETGNAIVETHSVVSGIGLAGIHSFMVLKRASPTIVVSELASLNFSGSYTVTSTVTDFYVSKTASGSGSIGFYQFFWTADATL